MVYKHSKRTIVEITIGLNSPTLVFVREFSLSGASGAEAMGIKGKKLKQYYRAKPEVILALTLFLHEERDTFREITDAFQNGIPVTAEVFKLPTDPNEGRTRLFIADGLIADFTFIATVGEYLAYQLDLGVSNLDVEEENQNFLNDVTTLIGNIA